MANFNRDEVRVIGNFELLIRSIFTFVKWLVIYSPILLIGYFLADKLKDSYNDKPLFKFFVTVLLSYLVYCFIYFLKGLLLVFRAYHNKIWIVLFVLCVLLTCAVPVLFSYLVVWGTFNNGQAAQGVTFWNKFFPVIIAGLWAMYVYSRYKFLTDIAPTYAFWAYKIGFDTVQKYYGNKNSDVADKSETDLI